MKKSKLEKVLEYMVNGEKTLASEMLHEHIIESAREIYADLAEEDEMFEEELDLDEDEDEDLDESFHDEDESDDFVDDLDSMEDELDAEHHFGEAEDDEDESLDDLEGEMDMDDDDDSMDMEMDMDMGDEGMGDDMDADASDADEAMQNVEDAMDELKAIFADLVGDDMDSDDMDSDGMDDEVADEFGDDDEGDDDMDDSFIDDDDLDEAAELKKHGNVKMSGDDDNGKSPIPQNASDMSDGHADPVKFAAGQDEKGGKGDTAKKMNVTGPQDQKGKMDKKVNPPKNGGEKAKSNIGS